MGRFTIYTSGDQGTGKTTALNLIEDTLTTAGYIVSADEGYHTLAVQSPAPLPAPALTEDAIVAALKADPGMAGRVIAMVAWKTSHDDRAEMGRYARDFVNQGSGITLRGTALQSLAVALAAASYRG